MLVGEKGGTPSERGVVIDLTRDSLTLWGERERMKSMPNKNLSTTTSEMAFSSSCLQITWKRGLRVGDQDLNLIPCWLISSIPLSITNEWFPNVYLFTLNRVEKITPAARAWVRGTKKWPKSSPFLGIFTLEEIRRHCKVGGLIGCRNWIVDTAIDVVRSMYQK